MKEPIQTKLTVLGVAAACLGLGVLFASTLDWTPTTHAVQSDIPVSRASIRSTGNAFTEIAREVTPTVVSIQSDRLVERGAGPSFGPFDRFFDIPRPDGNRGERRMRGAGSGLIVRSDGVIMTNNHVVEGAERIRVALNDGREFEAELVGRDPTTDIAIVKIDADGLPAARFAADDDIQVGEWVLAFGNPFGNLDFTMTAGIVSAIGRGINIIDETYAIEDFIQTDAAINPGNSGGPLVNIDGQVVGINTAIASRNGVFQGYGFAIPIAIARRVMDQILETGEVRRAILGVSIRALTPLDREALGLPSLEGVFIDGFSPDTPDNPARRGGIEPRDVVLAVDGERIETPSELQQKIAFSQPGKTVELTVWRNGREVDLDVHLGERPSADSTPQLAHASGEALGMTVQNLAPQTRQLLARGTGIDPSEIPDGVFIRDVQPLTAADDAGLSEGLVITRVGDRPVTSMEEYRAAIDELEPGSVVYFRVWAGGAERFVAIRIPD